jgi:ATP-binding cassette subfamily B protein
VLAGTFTIGTNVAFAAYLGQLYGPLTSLTTAPVELAQSMVSFERVFEVLDTPVEIEERSDARSLVAANGRIEFENICFDYEHLSEGQSAGLEEVARFGWHASDSDALLTRGKEPTAKENGDEPLAGRQPRWALEDVSFTIEPGQLAALVGPSGAGKTTITYMIPRLYDPTDGRVMIDGSDIRDVSLQSLADNIGMVTQETYLFYDTIRANLVYAKPAATEQQMISAAKAANIHEFIAELPDGYDTVVGERGYRLSGGERQRIAIARVLLKDARILVLDEATSSLDSLSEALIQEALQRVMEGRTSLVIAHRLSTILAAEVILVMEKGRLVEQGIHADLLAQGGLYASLYETQFQPAQP